ncbi:signal peptidase I [Paenibacillus chitinolyticus]|uniref:signal peptidase I n=1 Tax=Paenibacillus chitinolyticus TaxID=79263 RepID=UPI002DBF7AEB|nr:signal peptidase I [Paenibacillus chitinolyticus]MEC0248790.1 signal peptidase I [Paenibacillus chitinolyticus]
MMERREQEVSAETENVAAPAKNPVKKEAWEWIKALLIAAVLVFLIRWLLFAPFIVEGPSMEPNFHTGERLIVNKIKYKFSEPKRGEVIVLHAPEGIDYIKRIVALPGETIKVDGDKVYVNDKVIEEPYIKEAIDNAVKEGHAYNRRNFPEAGSEGTTEIKVPDKSVFVMGDNRSNSKDSRFAEVGFVSYDKIVGRADLVFWPLNKAGFVHF